jgi:hypothetical protein
MTIGNKAESMKVVIKAKETDTNLNLADCALDPHG